ncbi:MAG: pyridoxal-phosphate-dependent aminotransferase family protein [Acidimicrobiales bacterium]
MSLRFGRQMVATPGPSVIPDRVLTAMATPMPNLYEGEIVEISHSLVADLPGLVQTGGEPFMVIGNGHAAWQMSIANTLTRGDRVLVLESGRFALYWGEMARQAGIEVEVLPGDNRGPVDPAALEARLAADAGHTIRAVLTVHTDTASSVRNDVPALRAAMDAAGHPALLMVDAIASLGCERYEMDAWGVDLTVGACQKGLMVPPGLAFVWAGPRALEAQRSMTVESGYFDWSLRMNVEAHYQLYSGTPPISHLYGLRAALDLITEEGGLEAVWARHQVLADATRAAVDAWATPDGIEPNIIDPASRSNAVTTILTHGIDAARLSQICDDRAGLTLGLGIGDYRGRSFRIGHMGHLNPPMLLGTIGTIEAALGAMRAPTAGSGVAAAAEVVAAGLRS